MSEFWDLRGIGMHSSRVVILILVDHLFMEKEMFALYLGYRVMSLLKWLGVILFPVPPHQLQYEELVTSHAQVAVLLSVE